jgi:hypothetical protein
MLPYDSDSLGWLKIVQNTSWQDTRVKVIDQVSDGCWSKPKAAKTAVELELKRSNYEVATKHLDGDNEIQLIALGHKTSSGSCVVTLETSLRVNVTEFDRSLAVFPDNNNIWHELKNIRRHVIWDNKRIFSGPKAGFGARIRESFVTDVQEILNIVENKKKGLLNSIEKTYNVNYPEPRAKMPSERRVLGDQLEKLRQHWRKYFNGPAVKGYGSGQ